MIEPILTVTTDAPAPGVMVLSAAGEIDHDSHHVLGEAAETALRQGGERLVIDLTEVTFFGAAGVRVIIAARQHAASLGRAFRLRGVHGTTGRVLALAGVLSQA